MKNSIKILLVFLTIMMFSITQLSANHYDTINSVTKNIEDSNGCVSVKVDWLARPGEIAITVVYDGYLTQEGMVNMYLSVNGTQREFVTLASNNENRKQQIKIISYHPTQLTKGVNKLIQLPEDTIVDYILFRNAPYYSQFGEIDIECKFFCNSRWDGDDANNNDGNYHLTFSSLIKSFPQDHF